MYRKPNEMKSSVFWVGRPWIFPSVLARTILFMALAIFVSWLEFYFGLAFTPFVNVQIIYWTSLVLKFSNKYVLRNDSLEIKTGIASLTSFIITSSGFSDLEVHQSLFERAIDAGKIVIFSQSEKDYKQKMVKVRHPMKIAEQIRFVMARPIVRLKGTEEKKAFLDLP